MPFRWEENSTEEPWSVEIEHDCFDEDEGMVVSILTAHDDGDGQQETLATPSPAQAREMAEALLKSADAAEDWQKRKAKQAA